MPRLISFAACMLASIVMAGVASAHHGPADLGTVRITQPVMVGGTVLQPGTYQVRDAGEHVMPLPGQSADAQSRIEFLRDGMVVALDIAEVQDSEGGTVGTSGTTTRLKFEQLKGGDFVRISGFHKGERYLIHLPVGH